MFYLTVKPLTWSVTREHEASTASASALSVNLSVRERERGECVTVGNDKHQRHQGIHNYSIQGNLYKNTSLFDLLDTWQAGSLSQIYASLRRCFCNLTVAASGTGTDL